MLNFKNIKINLNKIKKLSAFKIESFFYFIYIFL